MTGKATKRTTVADMIAAAKLGTMSPDTEVLTVADAAKALDAAVANVAAATVHPAESRPSGAEHECAIPGCKHGATHGAPAQPDRQVKLQCPQCGAVARMTSSAISKSVAHGGGIRCGADGGTFIVATRRTYKARA